jgi:hypothetical protein
MIDLTTLHIVDKKPTLIQTRIFKLSLLFFAVGILLFILSMCKTSFKLPKETPADNYIKEQIKLIGEQNLLLQNKVDSLSIKVNQYNVKLEQLSKQKAKIQYIYENKLVQIDALDNSGIVKEFNIIFSKSNP